MSNWNTMSGQQNIQMPMATANAYPSQLPQTQQFRSYIPGRGVNSSGEIKAFEVPMDVPISVFPRNDLGEIYVKYWADDGTIKTKVFVEKEEVVSDTSSENSGILERLDRIEKILKKNKYRKPYQNNQKTEV